MEAFPGARQIDVQAPDTSALRLELIVRDPDVLAFLLRQPEGPIREEMALSALRVGVLAMRHAGGSLDVAAVQRETERLLGEVDKLITANAQDLKHRLTASLEKYFDPNTGHLVERLNRLVRKDGELCSLLSSNLAGESSVLARTLAQHVGAQSPLMQMLSPAQKDGLLARLQTSLEGALAEQSRRILEQFSLDSETSALSRLIKDVTESNGKLRKELAEDVKTVKSEFSLDNEQGALSRLSRSLNENIQPLIEGSRIFQAEVLKVLEVMQVRRQEAARGTQHGLEFEDLVGQILRDEAAALNDLHEATGNLGGMLGAQKRVGDHVITLGSESGAPGARIVVECKENQQATEATARAEIEIARKNRDAQIGIFVFSRECAPSGIRPFARYGSDLLVVWDKSDPGSDIILKAALSVARALAVRHRVSSESTRADLFAIDASVLAIEKDVAKVDEIRTWATTIQNNSTKIIKSAEMVLANLSAQIEMLKQHVRSLKLEER